MVQCVGHLVLHDDGSVVGCSEEISGRRCVANYDHDRHRSFASCRDYVPSRHCQPCDHAVPAVDGRGTRGSGGPGTCARVLTFNIDPTARHRLVEALDAAEENLALCPSFRGLLCLEDDGPLPRITVISLWDAGALDETATEHAEARQLFADTTGLGVTSRVSTVVRTIAGLHASLEAELAGAGLSLRGARPY